MRIYAFKEWAENKNGNLCDFALGDLCCPSAQLHECVNCYEAYVNANIPKYCKEAGRE